MRRKGSKHFDRVIQQIHLFSEVIIIESWRKVSRYFWLSAMELKEWELCKHFFQGPRQLGSPRTGLPPHNTLFLIFWQCICQTFVGSGRIHWVVFSLEIEICSGITFPFCCQKEKKRQDWHLCKAWKSTPKGGIATYRTYSFDSFCEFL